MALPFVTHPVCLPILFRLWGGKGSASSVELAGRLFGLLADTFPGGRIHAVGDAAYHGQPLLAGGSPSPPGYRPMPPCSPCRVWYATAGHHPDDLAHRLTSEPRYADKTEPAFEDMLGKLHPHARRSPISPTRPDLPDPHIIHDSRACALAAA